MISIKYVVYLVSALGVALTILWGVNYLKDSGRFELQLETLETEIKVRSNIDEAIRRSPRSVDDAIRMLRERQSARD